MATASGIRAPAVAGLFYPREQNELADMVDQLLASVPAPVPAPGIRCLLSPHAGYAYSGRVAAAGFRHLAAATSGSAAPTVVIIGPSHVEPFDFTSVFDGAAYRTPLGDVPVDATVARALASAHPSIRAGLHGHVQPRLARGEHGIEVQLPFLQRALGEARVVPIVMGSQEWDECAVLGDAIAAVCDPHSTVVIASSDLSHFYPYERAVRLDTAFCERLEALDAQALHQSVRRGECEACGAGPVTAALIATRALSQRACRILARNNSGDVTGDRARVVGYASAIVTGERVA